MRADTTSEHRIAVVEQVVRRDGGSDVALGLAYVIGCVAGGDVLEHDAQGRQRLAQRLQDTFDEDSLAVKQVDVAISDFAMNQQRQTQFLHHLQRAHAALEVGDAGVGVGGGAGRIQLDTVYDAALDSAPDLVWAGVIGQIERHQRIEAHAIRHSSQNALPIGSGHRGGRDRRLKVGHHDGAGKLPRRVRDHIGQHCAVAQVHMPVVGTGEGQGAGSRHGYHSFQWS